MAAATLREVAERFGQFYVPRFEIRSGGSGISPTVVRDVMSVTYNDSITEIDSVDIVVNNWDVDTRKFKYVGAEQSVRGDDDAQKLFIPRAAEFEVKFGYGSELATIMRGSTTSLEPSFPASGAPTLTVRLLNVLHRLRTKKHRDHWPNNRVARGQVKLSKVAQDIGERRVEGCRFPIPIRISQDALRDEAVLEYLAQDNQYDIDFLILLARRNGYVVYVTQERASGGGTTDALYFGPADVLHPGVPDVAYDLQWGESLIDFTPKLTTANQVTSVTVRGWDRSTNRAINKTAHLDDAEINDDLHELLSAAQADLPADECREREELVTNIPHFTPEEAEHHAVRILNDRLNQMVEANGTTVGLPDLRAGQKIYIRGLGRKFSGRYFVTKTTHTLDDSGYRTKFTARREKELEEST